MEIWFGLEKWVLGIDANEEETIIGSLLVCVCGMKELMVCGLI